MKRGLSKKGKSNEKLAADSKRFGRLMESLRTLIIDARQQALRAVDLVQVRACWEMGRHIVTFEQGGAARAEYGAELLGRLRIG